MNKWYLLIFGILLIGLAAACGQTAVPDAKNDLPTEAEEQTSEKDVPETPEEDDQPAAGVLNTADLAAVLAALDLTDASLVNRTQKEETSPAKAAIRAERYIETLKSYVWKEYTLPAEWDDSNEYFCRLIAPGVTITAYQHGYRGDCPLHLVTEEGEGWFILPYIREDGDGVTEQVRWMAYDTFFSWCVEAAAAALYQTGGIPLTAEELDTFAAYTASDRTEYVEEHGGYYNTSATEISCFFTSLYSDPRDMDAGEFLWYCPHQGNLEARDEAEWETVQKRLDWRFGEDGHLGSLSEMPVPVHRLPRTHVNEILMRHAGISVEEMHTNWLEEAFYVPETDCFYTFSSDYGPGIFRPCYGEKDGDTVTLWTAPDDMGSTRVLTLQNVGDGWHILSHVKIGD